MKLRAIRAGYSGNPVLHGITLDFAPGEFAAIAGPNGAGKSTLLSILAGLFPRHEGECSLDGRPVPEWPRGEFARSVAFVPQSVRIDFPFTARQVVLMGRAPFADGLFESEADHEAARRAMALTDTLAFAARDFRSLSGGEKQRVVLASALAQSPRVLLLDEPATFLDLKHQVSIYTLLRHLASSGILVIAVTHDLNLASAFASRLILLHQGRIAADGPPVDVLTEANIQAVFDTPARVHRLEDRSWLVYG
ncbi:MAG: ABC transporter ATP-binding protein [Acidobacteria bacterium]|nr:ABC transporter ATP-binding protein [Acidobacteriota bacterium]